jgi:OTT_1508-like deaminase
LRNLHGEVKLCHFERILLVINLSLENTKFDDKNTLLRQVVLLDLKRILSRLRSRHAQKTQRTKGKQALISLLCTSIQDKSIRPKSGVTCSKIDGLRSKVTDLEALFDKIESIENLGESKEFVQDILVRIVQQAHEIAHGNELRSVLQTSGILSPSLKAYLPEALGKVGRYYSASLELICAARDRHCRVFLNVRIEPFQLSGPNQIIMLREPPSIEEAVRDFTQLNQLTGKRNSRRQKGDNTTSALLRRNEEFRERMTLLSTLGKVHAEIQLLFFYELHPDRLLPRTICSSKSACFLCNTFMQLHGRFFTARTHGRLYDRWILPDWVEGIPLARRQELSVVITRFNSDLEERIRRVLTTGHEIYNHPNESVLIPPAYWPSTSVSTNTSNTTSAGSASTLRQPISVNPGPKTSRGCCGTNLSATATRERSIGRKSDTPTEQPPAKESAFRVEQDSRTAYQSPQLGLPNATTYDTAPGPAVKPYPEQSTPSRVSSISLPQNVHAVSNTPQFYERLARGRHARKQYVDANRPLLISTKSINMSISPYMRTPETEDASGDSNINRRNRNWVQVKWLGPDDLFPSPSSKHARVVHIEEIAPGSEIQVAPEPEDTGTGTIYVCYAGNTIAVTYGREEC